MYTAGASLQTPLKSDFLRLNRFSLEDRTLIQISHSTYDIQFEKFDTEFKGIGQVINQETAKYLSRKCRYLNREQDLGIKGVRQAKLSYEPVKLLTPCSLSFAPSN